MKHLEIDLGTGLLTLSFERQKDRDEAYALFARLIALVKERRLHGPPLTEAEEVRIEALIGRLIESAR